MPLGIVSNEDFAAEVDNSATVFTPPTILKDIDSRKTPELINPLAPSDNDSELGQVVTSDAVIKRMHNGGRNEGDVNVPQSMRKLIGDTATFEGRKSALELAASLGISPASVSGYTNPNNSALSETNKDDIFSLLTTRKTKLSKRALNKLSLALSYIDEGKLQDLGARDLSAVAKDMAVVAKQMEPPSKESEKAEPVQFHFYAPQVRQENHYDVVTAKDNY